jgi:DNA repair protein RadC
VYEIKLQMVRQPIAGYDGRRRYSASTPVEIAELMRPMVADLPREVLYVLCLDAANRVVGIYLVGAGTLDRAPAHAREIFAPALMTTAAKIVLVHNHPSGAADPSTADLHLTRRMREAGELIGIPLVDHVIIGSDGGYHSLHEAGLVP